MWKTRTKERSRKNRRNIQRASYARCGVGIDVCTLLIHMHKGSFVCRRSESVNEQVVEVCKVVEATCLDLDHCTLGVDGVHYDARGGHAVSV